MNFGRPTKCPKRSECQKVVTPGKYRYLMPLDAEMRQKVLPLAQPYPRRRSVEIDAPAIHAGEGGETPTRRLHSAQG